MLASPIPDLILCEVLRIRPEDLPAEKAKVDAAIQRYALGKRQEQPGGVGKDMDIARAVAILEALAEGIDPLTREAFPEGSPCHQPTVIRALYTAVRELRHLQIQANSAGGAPANAGKPWAAAEEEQLRQEFAARLSIPDIARRHGRTRVAILGRLMRLGLLSADGGPSALEQGDVDLPMAELVKRPGRAGHPWTTEEDAELLRGFDAGVAPQQLAERLQRGVRAVEVRLCKHGRFIESLGAAPNKSLQLTGAALRHSVLQRPASGPGN